MEQLTASLPVLLCLMAILPFISFLYFLFLGKPAKGAPFALTAIGGSFIIAAIVFSLVWNKTSLHFQAEWFSIGLSSFSIGIILNNLSALMLLLITGIALLVHIYSAAYMKADPGLNRYWAYLALFCFSMIGLVVVDNLLLLYLFWELVGFSSYLLIGFWFTRDAAVRANKKAFIVNRIGDLGLLTGIMILFCQFRTLDIEQLFGSGQLVSLAAIMNGEWVSQANHMPAIWLTVAGIAMLLGAIAKSAQFPLHTWLPDAMEGPTPVSSLIHAATMVAAGVFLVVLIYPLFDPFVLNLITGIGIFTAFMASTIALAQHDIKKILAWSTVSQLGFMMLAAGTGAPDAAMFHLATHAFFKCLLFLGAGSVIHEMHHFKDNQQLDFDHQDIRNMGGLRKQMPVTFICMLVAALALAGIPFTSGYLSKDAILINVYEWSHGQLSFAQVVPYLAILVSWLTTFYIAKLIFAVFFGRFRWSNPERLHEAPTAMKVPMIVLAACSLFPLFSFAPFSFERAWLPAGFKTGLSGVSQSVAHLVIPIGVNIVAAGIVFLVWKRTSKTSTDVRETGTAMRFLGNGWYFNEFYQFVVVNPVLTIARVARGFDKRVVDGVVNASGAITVAIAAVATWVDKYIIDASVNLLGSISKSIGNFARQFQSGKIQNYVFAMLVAVLTIFILNYFSRAI